MSNTLTQPLAGADTGLPSDESFTDILAAPHRNRIAELEKAIEESKTELKEEKKKLNRILKLTPEQIVSAIDWDKLPKSSGAGSSGESTAKGTPQVEKAKAWLKANKGAHNGSAIKDGAGISDEDWKETAPALRNEKGVKVEGKGRGTKYSA